MRKNGKEDYFSIRFHFGGDEGIVMSALEEYEHNRTNLKDVNKVLELYNISQLFEQKGNYYDWDEDKFNKSVKLITGIREEVRGFFDAIDEDNVVGAFQACVIQLRDSFFEFFYIFKVYERISKNRFDEIITWLRLSPEKLLENKAFVTFFENEIVDKLKQPDFGARFFVNRFMRESKGRGTCYLPKSLTAEDIYRTVSAYIDGDDVNTNILTLIKDGKTNDSKRFEPDDYLRLKAKRRIERFWKENAGSALTIIHSYGVEFNEETDFKAYEHEGTSILVKYSYNWIKDNLDYSTLLNNFIYMFEYVDSEMLWNHVPGDGSLGFGEKLFTVEGNGMYNPGQTCRYSNIIADRQMEAYVSVLKKLNVSLEDVFKWFFEVYLKDEFGVEGFECSFPQKDDSIVKKCKLLASAMDGVLKQYKLFVKYGEIDRELYEMSNEQIVYEDLPSFFKQKYAYAQCGDLNKAMGLLFSDQSVLTLRRGSDKDYRSLCMMLGSEKLTLEDFEEFQMDEIGWLIEKGYIHNDKFLTLNKDKVRLLNQLYERGCVCLKYSTSDELDSMIEKGELKTEGLLLSRQEADHINYFLNKRKYNNGPNIRNRYIHDSIPKDEHQQKQDYITLLRVMVVLIIKINEEFCLRDEI